MSEQLYRGQHHLRVLNELIQRIREWTVWTLRKGMCELDLRRQKCANDDEQGKKVRFSFLKNSAKRRN